MSARYFWKSSMAGSKEYFELIDSTTRKTIGVVRYAGQGFWQWRRLTTMDEHGMRMAEGETEQGKGHAKELVAGSLDVAKETLRPRLSFDQLQVFQKVKAVYPNATTNTKRRPMVIVDVEGEAAKIDCIQTLHDLGLEVSSAMVWANGQKTTPETTGRRIRARFE